MTNVLEFIHCYVIAVVGMSFMAQYLEKFEIKGISHLRTSLQDKV